MPNSPEKKQLPLVLRLAAERLNGIFNLYALTQADRYRTMRRERQEAIRAVLEALFPRVCLQADGLAIVMDEDQTGGKPLTVAALAAAAGIGVRRAKRAIYDLRLAGLLEIKPQWRRRADGGRTLLVAACLRRLTRKFWAALGLWGLYVETVRYMQGRPLIRIKVAVYEVAASLGRRVLPLLGGRRGPRATTGDAQRRFPLLNKPARREALPLPHLLGGSTRDLSASGGVFGLGTDKRETAFLARDR